MPFTEGAQYGIELFYPYDNELRVTKQDGQVVLDGDFGPDPENGINWPPFRPFGENYYTYQLLLDLKVADDMAVRTEPHPRYYTVAGRRRAAGGAGAAAHELVADDLVRGVQGAAGRLHARLPARASRSCRCCSCRPSRSSNWSQMDEEEAAEREMRGRRIHASRDTLSKETTWTSSTDTVFDGTYRHILRAAKAKAQESGVG